MEIITGNVVDVVGRRIFSGSVHVNQGHIVSVEETNAPVQGYILPGLTDAHIHIESSLLVPSSFARLAVVHGTVCAVADPHEIGNVLGIDGVRFMIRNGKEVPFRFVFGAPSCIPATPFETNGASLTDKDIEELFDKEGVSYLSEMMNFPGVLSRDPVVMLKIQAARVRGLPVDGHAPGLTGPAARQYAEAGITTDHECSSLDEALTKIASGMKILIREGSAARNFDSLMPLLRLFPESIMFCSDDLHPDDLEKGHMNRLIKRALNAGYGLFEVLRACTLNPALHYKTGVGLLQPGDPADFIRIDNFSSFSVLETRVNGQKVAERGKCLIPHKASECPNQFITGILSSGDFELVSPGGWMRVIEVEDGQIVTREKIMEAPPAGIPLRGDEAKDLAILAVINRYSSSAPALAVVSGMGIRKGAMACSVAHDSHNIIAAGSHPAWIEEAVNEVIRCRGGMAVAGPGFREVLPLSVAGLMNNADAFEVSNLYKEIQRAAHMVSYSLTAPLMTLSFLSLLVIPHLKLSDRGLFDGHQFRFVPVFFL